MLCTGFIAASCTKPKSHKIVVRIQNLIPLHGQSSPFRISLRRIYEPPVHVLWFLFFTAVNFLGIWCAINSHLGKRMFKVEALFSRLKDIFLLCWIFSFSHYWFRQLWYTKFTLRSLRCMRFLVQILQRFKHDQRVYLQPFSQSSNVKFCPGLHWWA